jgi:hypothetical protein
LEGEQGKFKCSNRDSTNAIKVSINGQTKGKTFSDFYIGNKNPKLLEAVAAIMLHIIKFKS